MERKHILKILKQTKNSIKKSDNRKLKDLSNKTIHSASIHQDIDSILTAVIVYSLGKITERTNYQEYEDWPKFRKSFEKHINKAIFSLEKNQIDNFRKEMENIRRDISKISGNFKKHLEQVFEKASINKGSRIYEHGISIGQTSKLLGISEWELMEYVGKTGIQDVNLNVTLPIEKRIKRAEQFLK